MSPSIRLPRIFPWIVRRISAHFAALRRRQGWSLFWRITIKGFVMAAVVAAASTWAAEDPVQLRPVQVKENPFGSLGISARARSTFWSAFSRDEKVKNLIITAVAAGSIADQRGLKAGDQVMSIDGTPIQELSVRIIGELWHQKEVGEIVRFEIVRGEAKERKLFELPIIKAPEKKQPKR